MRLISILVFGCISTLCSQAQQIQLRGKVFDETGIALPGAFISSSLGKWITDRNGRFLIRMAPADTISISHVGFQTYFFQPLRIQDTLTIKMTRESVELRTITILSYQTEEELKEKILESPVVESEQVQNARDNLQKIRTLYALGYRPQMNGYERFKESMKQPQGVTFFSSSGGGLLKAIKNAVNKPSVSYKPLTRQTAKPTGLIFVPKRKILNDTLKSDTAAARMR